MQTWEKLVAPGLTYRMEVDLSLPRVIHAIRYSPGALSTISRPELAQSVVFIENDETKGRATLSSTIAATGAIGGINADFFPWNGDPLGIMVRGGELVSKPFTGRSVFAWGAGYFETAVVGYEGKLVLASGEALPIHGINEECGDNMLVANTTTAGIALSRTPAVHAILDVSDVVLRPEGSWKGKVRIFEPDKTSRKIEKNEIVLTATGNMVPKLMKAARDSEVTISIKMPGIDWKKATHAVGGGPAVVSAGKVVRSFTGEGFTADFTDKRHPRTAIGATKEGDVWLVVVDGRQANSRGATLGELGQIMFNLGCRSAINLDGGGSSTLNLMGLTLNRPSDGVERAISNSILLFSTAPAAPPSSDPPMQMVITGQPRVSMGKPQTYHILTEAGEVIPDGEVLWSASGNAWVDQSGLVRGLKAGPATLSAYTRGRIIKIDIAIVDAAPATVPPGKK